MRRITLSSRTWLSLALLTSQLSFCLLSSSAQEDSDHPAVPRMAGVSMNPVSGAPFSGTVEFVSRQKLPDGSVYVLKTINHIARDSSGRTHTESRRFISDLYKQEPPLTETRIYDPTTRLMTHLEPFAFIARQNPMHAPPIPDMSAVPDPNPAAPVSWVKQVNDLGTRSVHGVTLRGIRQINDGDHFNEFWYCPELSIYLERRRRDPVWDQTITVTELTLQEPDASNFTVPAGYKTVQVKEPVPTPDASGVYHVGNGVLPPVLTFAPEPEFTDEARRLKYGGTVVVSLVVDAQGHPQDMKVIRHLKMGLDQSAIAAVQRYKFKPGTVDGKPVPVTVDIVVTFKIY